MNNNTNLGACPPYTAARPAQENYDRSYWTGPSDLRQALGPRQLVVLVLDAVQAVEEVRALDKLKDPAQSPRMMLTLLSYCYASGIYGSRQIEEAIRENSMVRYICAKTYPTAQEIRQFRRQHRDLIEKCLIYILKQAWALRLDNADVEYLGLGWYESELVQRFDREAFQRVDVASFVDLMDLER